MSDDPQKYQKLIEMQAAMQRRIAEEESILEQEGKEKAAVVTFSISFLSECRECGEFGDSVIYAEQNRNKFIFNPQLSTWMFFENHIWHEDVTGKANAAVQCVVDAYVQLANYHSDSAAKACVAGDTEKEKYHLHEHKKTLSRIKEIRSRKRNENILWHASRTVPEPLSCLDDIFNRDPWLLACQNGIIDLKNGFLRPGRPEDYISLACPVPFISDAPCPVWEKFLYEIFEEKTELVSFVQRLLGYCLTGKTSEHIFVVLYGPNGRNGKGTMLETLKLCLGPLHLTIKPEMLLEQKGNAGGPDNELCCLKGARVAQGSETNKGASINHGKIKLLTGGDTLTARWSYTRRPITFKPTHKLFLLTNERPHAGADDLALWARIVLIPFNLRYVEEPKAENERPIDKNLDEKLKNELSGILAWMVRGCLEWQRIGGLDIPEIVKASTNEYKDDEDILGRFIEDRCELTGEVRAMNLYEEYRTWCQSTGMRAMKETSFGRQMKKRFSQERDNHGRYYIGLSIKNENL